tara:strand:+ start:478 stop:633 length:156 start_codon:yes stop_codon:yes gene_type:complete
MLLSVAMLDRDAAIDEEFWGTKQKENHNGKRKRTRQERERESSHPQTSEGD